MPEMSQALERFQTEMASVDEVAHVLLKGHLLLEEALTRIIEQYVFHRQRLVEVRLTFHQKVFLGRALCLRKDSLGEWDLILAINSLRNEIAHNLNSPRREAKLAKVKEIYFREAAATEGVEETKKQQDSVILLNACGHCSGFLVAFESDSKSLRKLVHKMDRSLNPDLPEFEL